jgi:RNA recognition motif-containing protein
MNRKLFVANLSIEARAAELQALFSQAGEVAAVTLVRDDAAGRERSVAYVEMQSEDGARAVVARFDHHQLHGVPLTVVEHPRRRNVRGDDRRAPGNEARPLVREWTYRDGHSAGPSESMLDEGGPLRTDD